MVGRRQRYIYFNHGPQNFNIEPTGDLSRRCHRRRDRTGRSRPLGAPRFRSRTPTAAALIYAANPDSVDLSLWWRDLATGRDTRLTSGVGEYTHPSLSSDGQRLIGTVIDSRQALAARPRSHSIGQSHLEPVTDGYSGDFDPVVVAGWRSRSSSARREPATGTCGPLAAAPEQPAPLTTGMAHSTSGRRFRPTGSEIAFVSDRGGRRGIWLVSAEGGTPRLVATRRRRRHAQLVAGRQAVWCTRLPIGDAPGPDGQSTWPTGRTDAAHDAGGSHRARRGRATT